MSSLLGDLLQAAKPEFKNYSQQVIDNTSLAKVFTERGLKLTSGGSDNHLVLIDLRPSDLRKYAPVCSRVGKHNNKS